MNEQEAADILLKDPELERCEHCEAGMIVVKLEGVDASGNVRDDSIKVICGWCAGSQRAISKRYEEAKRVLGVKDGPIRGRRSPTKGH